MDKEKEMSWIAIQIRKQSKFKVVKNSNSFKLEFEVEEPEWVSIYINGKHADLGTFLLDKDQLTFTDEVERGSEIIVRDFIRVGKTKKQKQNTKEN